MSHAWRYTNLKKIPRYAVELSGGFDTALIIAILKKIEAPIYLIGVRSDRYEFRTERKVQDYFSSYGTTIFIPEEEATPFTKLLDCPSHRLPNKAALFYRRHVAVAAAATKLSVSSIINGLALEPLICEPVSADVNNFRFEKWKWEDPWPNEYVYGPQGKSYVNIATYQPFAQLARHMRKGQLEDSHKTWARSEFKSYLPTMLTEHRYKAAFDGVYESSLQKAETEIREVGRIAFDISKCDALKPENLVSYITRYNSLSHREEIIMMARISYALWIYCLSRDGVI